MSATVVEGRYGLWLPQSLADSATELVARDANGAELLPGRPRLRASPGLGLDREPPARSFFLRSNRVEGGG